MEQLIENYRNTYGITKSCINKIEGHRKLIQVFQNLRKDGQTERRTDRNYVTYWCYEKPQLNYSHTLQFILSIIHELYSGLSATRDWAWGALKLV